MPVLTTTAGCCSLRVPLAGVVDARRWRRDKRCDGNAPSGACFVSDGQAYGEFCTPLWALTDYGPAFAGQSCVRTDGTNVQVTVTTGCSGDGRGEFALDSEQLSSSSLQQQREQPAARATLDPQIGVREF